MDGSPSTVSHLPDGPMFESVDHLAKGPRCSGVLVTPHSPIKRFLPETWEDDESLAQCSDCNKKFSLLVRRHHCRNCGSIYCAECTKNRLTIHEKHFHEPVRVCDRCYFSLILVRRSDERASPSRDGGASVVSGQSFTPTAQLVDSSLVSLRAPVGVVSLLKSEVKAMEEVSSAFMQENRELRTVIDKLEQLFRTQKEAIDLLQKENEQQRQLLAQREALFPLHSDGTSMEVVPVPNSGAQHPVRVDANMDRDDLLQQIGKLENELREVHVRAADERDALYDDLMCGRSSIQMLESELSRLSQENEAYQAQLSKRAVTDTPPKCASADNSPHLAHREARFDSSTPVDSAYKDAGCDAYDSAPDQNCIVQPPHMHEPIRHYTSPPAGGRDVDKSIAMTRDRGQMLQSIVSNADSYEK